MIQTLISMYITVDWEIFQTLIPSLVHTIQPFSIVTAKQLVNIIWQIPAGSVGHYREEIMW